MTAPAAVLVAAAIALAACGPGGSAVPAATPAAGDPTGAWVTIAARDITFDEAEVRVPSNQPFTLVLQNRDALPHNVSIYAGAAGGERRFEGAVFNGPATRWYAVPALAPGAYRFVCDVHPNMTARLIAS